SDGVVARSLRGAGELVDGARRRGTRVFARPVTRMAGHGLRLAVHRPGRVLGVALALAVVGWGLETQLSVVSDLPRLVPQSLPAVFRTPASSASRAAVRALLDAVPAYFSRAAITPDRRTAVLAFGIRLESLARQHAVMADMRARLKPPPGVTASLAGLPVLAADANHALADPV